MAYIAGYPASNYDGRPIVSIQAGDLADKVIEMCLSNGAIFEDDTEPCFIIEFPDRTPELYTESALRGSLTPEAWARRK